MALLTLIPQNTKFDFVSKRMIFFAFSIFIVLSSLGGWAFKGLNFGVDFKGGFLLEVRTSDPANLGEIRSSLKAMNLGDVKVQDFGSDYDVIIRIERQPGGDAAQSKALEQIKEALGNVEYRRIDTVGPKVSEDLKINGMIAFLLASFAMLVYIWFRFEWNFGLCAVIALIHDCIIIMGLYAFVGIEFNETALIAILTTLGYSINDTVVIYDRVRENLRKYKKMDIPLIINMSINHTLSRTALTSFTTLLALSALYLFGGNVISTFTMPIIVGVLIGTYSSICLATMLLLFFDLRILPTEEKDLETDENSGISV